LNSGGGEYVDAISIHAYVGRTPNLSLNVIRNLQQLLIDNRYENKQIWNTETNVSCNSTLEDCNEITKNATSVASGENALAQGMLGNAALGIVSFTYYTWEGASIEDGGLGLVQNDFTKPTKAGVVYSNIKAWINGAELTYIDSESNGLNIVKIERHGQQAYAIWSFKQNQKLNLSLFSKAKMLMRANGFVKNITESSIDIGQEPILLFPKSFNFDTDY
jgi:hypothetical protein